MQYGRTCPAICKGISLNAGGIDMTKILLVEDSEAIILGLTYLLQEEGFFCAVARTKEEALDMF